MGLRKILDFRLKISDLECGRGIFLALLTCNLETFLASFYEFSIIGTKYHKTVRGKFPKNEMLIAVHL